ncbi:MAG: hypothetical protein AB1779_00100 [Candidatus Thermoplasmatota archaeon]
MKEIVESRNMKHEGEEKIIFDESTNEKIIHRKKKIKINLALIVIFGLFVIPITTFLTVFVIPLL